MYNSLDISKYFNVAHRTVLHHIKKLIDKKIKDMRFVEKENTINGRIIRSYDLNCVACHHLLISIPNHNLMKWKCAFVSTFETMKEIIENSIVIDIDNITEYAINRGDKMAYSNFQKSWKEKYKLLKYLSLNDVNNIINIDNISHAICMAAENQAMRVVNEGIEKEHHYKEIYGSAIKTASQIINELNLL